jgi:hypothetical protein
VPGQVHYNATRKLVLTGADGVVLVFDSQRARVDANHETLENLKENLSAHGKTLSDMPHVIQYNKRDLYDISSVDELERSLNRFGAPSFSTVATSGEGVYESLEAITRAVMEDFDRRMPETRALDRASLELPEGGLVDALRRAESQGGEPLFQQRSLRTHTSGGFRLSDLPETDVGEAAARAVTGEDPVPVPEPKPALVESPPVAGVNLTLPAASAGDEPAPQIPPQSQPGVVSEPAPVRRSTPLSSPAIGFSFGKLFPPNERGVVQVVESALSLGDPGAALSAIEQLVSRALASGAAIVGSSHDAPRDPALVVLLLGLEPRRYMRFRAVARDARSGEVVSPEAALGAYAFAIDIRRALWELG